MNSRIREGFKVIKRKDLRHKQSLVDLIVIKTAITINCCKA